MFLALYSTEYGPNNHIVASHSISGLASKIVKLYLQSTTTLLLHQQNTTLNGTDMAKIAI